VLSSIASDLRRGNECYAERAMRETKTALSVAYNSCTSQAFPRFVVAVNLIPREFWE
jgi:hypothetical protein